jgi:hypothetical protein
MRHAISFQDRRSLHSLTDFMSILPGGADVGGQPRTGKSRLREFTLSLGAFNLRMQALRQVQPSNGMFLRFRIPPRAAHCHSVGTWPSLFAIATTDNK